MYKQLWLGVLLLTLLGCQQASRYSQQQDSAPTFSPAAIDFVDATPKYEVYAPFNSRPYVVFGKQYTPLTTGKGYEAVGKASWYGQKFHGHTTSNGETYDMFTMTAAHKTLPLPSYVKVTNLENNKVAIVRVNDRGPFHSERIIDLSYAAAVKLGFHKVGTTKVKLEVIHVDSNNQVTVGSQPTMTMLEYAQLNPQDEASSQTAKAQESAQESTPADATPAIDLEKIASSSFSGYYIQVAALSDENKAKTLSEGLSSLYQVPTEMPLIDNIYRLRLGPLTDSFQLQMLLDDLKKNGYPGAYKVEATL
jgi:rare lipoprotein A